MTVNSLFAKTAAFFKADEPSRFQIKKEHKAEELQNEREVYRWVDRRDDWHCRCCGAACDPYALGLLRHGHHHHIEYRSAGGLTTKENVCLLCAGCHDEEHQHRLKIEGNAEERLTFSARDQAHGGYYVLKQEIGIHQIEHD